MAPPWIRLLPIAAAATVAWTADSMVWQPRVDRWSAERPPSWRGHVARRFGPPWMLCAGIVLRAAWFGVALLTTP